MNRSTIIIIREQKVRIDWKQVHPKLFVLFPISLVRVPLFYELFFQEDSIVESKFPIFLFLSLVLGQSFELIGVNF